MSSTSLAAKDQEHESAMKGFIAVTFGLRKKAEETKSVPPAISDSNVGNV
jgi:hypothetical protein